MERQNRLRLATLGGVLKLGDELDVMGDLHRLYYDLEKISDEAVRSKILCGNAEKLFLMR